jgi:hypothetical protein
LWGVSSVEAISRIGALGLEDSTHPTRLLHARDLASVYESSARGEPRPRREDVRLSVGGAEHERAMVGGDDVVELDYEPQDVGVVLVGLEIVQPQPEVGMSASPRPRAAAPSVKMGSLRLSESSVRLALRCLSPWSAGRFPFSPKPPKPPDRIFDQSRTSPRIGAWSVVKMVKTLGGKNYDESRTPPANRGLVTGQNGQNPGGGNFDQSRTTPRAASWSLVKMVKTLGGGILTSQGDRRQFADMLLRARRFRGVVTARGLLTQRILGAEQTLRSSTRIHTIRTGPR